jgi:hypothetical protein
MQTGRLTESYMRGICRQAGLQRVTWRQERDLQTGRLIIGRQRVLWCRNAKESAYIVGKGAYADR